MKFKILLALFIASSAGADESFKIDSMTTVGSLGQQDCAPYMFQEARLSTVKGKIKINFLCSDVKIVDFIKTMPSEK